MMGWNLISGLSKLVKLPIGEHMEAIVKALFPMVHLACEVWGIDIFPGLNSNLLVSVCKLTDQGYNNFPF